MSEEGDHAGGASAAHSTAEAARMARACEARPTKFSEWYAFGLDRLIGIA